MKDLLNEFFNEKKVKPVHMTGYTLNIENRQYHIAYEMLIGKPNTVLYRDDIYEIGNENEPLPKPLQSKIALEVQNELDPNGISIKIFPPIYDEMMH